MLVYTVLLLGLKYWLISWFSICIMCALAALIDLMAGPRALAINWKNQAHAKITHCCCNMAFANPG